MMIKESAKARLGETIEQSLLKQISSLHPNHGSHSLAFSYSGKVLPNALPSALTLSGHINEGRSFGFF